MDISTRPPGIRETGPAAPVAMTPEIWRNAVSLSVFDFEVDIARPQSFRGAVTSRSFADFEFIEMVADAHAAYRDSSKVQSVDRPSYLMPLQLAGEFRITQDGRTALLKPGQFAFYDSARPARLEAGDGYRTFAVKFPHRLLGASPDRLGELTARTADASDGIAPAVWSMLTTLNGTLDTMGPANRYTTVRGVVNLIESMLLPASALPQSSSSRDVLLERIKDYLDAHLGDVDLGPKGVADAHYISVRHLHSLFQDIGVSISTWVRDRRLDRCKADLADPALAAMPVSAIARRWGFRGASHFGHVFKSVTGYTPAEFRAMHVPALNG